MRPKKRRNFGQSLIHFLFGWLVKSVPEYYLADLVCDDHGQIACLKCLDKWDDYEEKHPLKAQRIKDRANRPGR